MAQSRRVSQKNLVALEIGAFREILGYLNFSSGAPNPSVYSNINRLHARLGADQSWSWLAKCFRMALDELKSTGEGAFVETHQAEAVVTITFDHLVGAYRSHHADLLFHLSDKELEQPFFLARLFEAVLTQGGDWHETDRVVAGALDRLNDFLGYRPTAVLENKRNMEPYAHERFCPLPLYVRCGGESVVAVGPNEELIARAIEFLQQTPPEILRTAHFDLDRMEELAVDLRAHDHLHPVNKRTNYMFGEWDPHRIDVKGFYRRFILRRIILESLQHWVIDHPHIPRAERLHDAGAVLCGTILMASAISGAGPDTHDSSVTLTSLLPKVARQRDTFYEQLLSKATGKRARRLEKAAESTRQPFGHVRQYLNMYLSRYGARQVQYRQLAQMYAKMGYAKSSRKSAAMIPSAGARFECEIQWRITAVDQHLNQGELSEAVERLHEIEDHLQRSIHCGALPDPWNILAFQGMFPLFIAREDSVPDQRIETLLELMERFFAVYSRTLSEAAATGNESLRQEISERFRRLADQWDRYATTAVEDLPSVSGGESWESARHVAEALSAWRAAGEAAGDISFWRQYVDRFQSPKAYALVVEALLDKGDHVASMGLLMQWLSQSEDVPLESGSHAFFALILRWMSLVLDSRRVPGPWPVVRRMFDYLEANAGECWSVPTIREFASGITPIEEAARIDDPLDDDSDDENLFEAAYDQMVYRDSTDDGVEGETLDDGYSHEETEFEAIVKAMEMRLKFLATLAQLWQMAATGLATHTDDANEAARESPTRADVLSQWCRRAHQLQKELGELLDAVCEYEIAASSGDFDANIEYDIQMQMKYFLVHTLITTTAACRTAERYLSSCLPIESADADRSASPMLAMYRCILRGDVLGVRLALPGLLDHLAGRPLLYVSLENGGDPRKILAARILQADIRFLLTQLPRMGLLEETFRLVETAYDMERSNRPGGQAVTEFDRLFRIALSESLRCIIFSAEKWRPRRRTFTGRNRRRPMRAIKSIGVGVTRFRHHQRKRSRSPRSHTRRLAPIPRIDRHFELNLFVEQFVSRYQQQWLKHSRTTQLSTVESLKPREIWEDVRDFIKLYGADLFHARMLTLGNLRTILHNGVEQFLAYLEEQPDPLHPVRLIDHIESGMIAPAHAARCLEVIYCSIVDRFERFVEYNTTTTQSDYGEKIYCLLDFMRVEAAYERNDWNETPRVLAHEVLAELGRSDAAQFWESEFRRRTNKKALNHLRQLRVIERKYGMCLPSVTDHLNERFVGPFAVHRMRALIPRAYDDHRAGRLPSPAFRRFEAEVVAYLESRTGSAVDLPDWLKTLEQDVNQLDPLSVEAVYNSEPVLPKPPVALRRAQIDRQLNGWIKQ